MDAPLHIVFTGLGVCCKRQPVSQHVRLIPRTATGHSASSLGKISGGKTGWRRIHSRRQAWEGLVASSALAGRGQELVGVAREAFAFPLSEIRILHRVPRGTPGPQRS